MKPVSVWRRAAKRRLLVVSCLGAFGLASCTGQGWDFSYPESGSKRSAPRYSNEKSEGGSLFGRGEDGFDIFGFFSGGSKDRGSGRGPGIGVNSFLWRASLDTISFMPLTSADPFGGVIITDWYTPPESPSERFKMSIYILGRQLRADGVRVAVFRQAQDGIGKWVDSVVKARTSVNLENQILTRARQLRIASASIK